MRLLEPIFRAVDVGGVIGDARLADLDHESRCRVMGHLLCRSVENDGEADDLGFAIRDPAVEGDPSMPLYLRHGLVFVDGVVARDDERIPLDSRDAAHLRSIGNDHPASRPPSKGGPSGTAGPRSLVELWETTSNSVVAAKASVSPEKPSGDLPAWMVGALAAPEKIDPEQAGMNAAMTEAWSALGGEMAPGRPLAPTDEDATAQDRVMVACANAVSACTRPDDAMKMIETWAKALSILPPGRLGVLVAFADRHRSRIGGTEWLGNEAAVAEIDETVRKSSTKTEGGHGDA